MSPLKILLFLLLTASASACNSGSDLITHEKKIYSVLLDHWGASAQRPAWIRSTSISLRDHQQDIYIEHFRGKIADIDSLRTAFDVVNETPSTLPLASSEEIVIFPEPEYQKIFASEDQSSRLRWKNFSRKNPQAHGLIEISRVGFDKTATKAIVYYHGACGHLCGNGYMAYLERGLFGWKLVWLEHLWVS